MPKKKRKEGLALSFPSAETVREKIEQQGSLRPAEVWKYLNVEFAPCGGNCKGGKKSPNCLCGLIPKESSYRRKGLWQKGAELATVPETDPSETRREVSCLLTIAFTALLLSKVVVNMSPGLLLIAGLWLETVWPEELGKYVLCEQRAAMSLHDPCFPRCHICHRPSTGWRRHRQGHQVFNLLPSHAILGVACPHLQGASGREYLLVRRTAGYCLLGWKRGLPALQIPHRWRRVSTWIIRYSRWARI
jgi:hypothetical protein